MRTLLLWRHAKSSWADPTVADHERPLAPRGQRAARRIAAHLRSDGMRPALVLCSSARRAVDTLAALRPALDDTTDIRIEEGLYGAEPQEMIDRLRQVDPGVWSVMIIGHNPGLQELALTLAGDGVDAALAQLHMKFPTCALATLDLEGADWARLGRARAYLSGLVLPRQLA